MGVLCGGGWEDLFAGVRGLGLGRGSIVHHIVLHGKTKFGSSQCLSHDCYWRTSSLPRLLFDTRRRGKNGWTKNGHDSGIELDRDQPCALQLGDDLPRPLDSSDDEFDRLTDLLEFPVLDM